jgi:hypothetical protein
MSAVAAVHFLANRDAHADRDFQRLTQPATVHERSDREHLRHGYSDRDRLEVADREHGSLTLRAHRDCHHQFIGVFDGIDVGQAEHHHRHRQAVD